MGSNHRYLPIAPIWNWNLSAPMFTCFGFALPIAPIWNWNWLRRRRWCQRAIYQSHQSGIETSSEYGTLSRTVGYQSHQSGIETLYRRQSGNKRRATNRTNLELKPGTLDTIAWTGRFYQSHQSGIETNESLASALPCLFYQSHQSGIETNLMDDLKLAVFSYQSHQSGIETDKLEQV